MEELYRPSGSVLPLLLRKKWRERESSKSSTQAAQISTQAQPNDKLDGIGLEPYPTSGSAEAGEIKNRIFTAQELEERIWKTTVVMVDIQKQIYRGEETYYEETHAHGNLFRGWDAFVDSKDVGLGNGSSSAPPGSGPSRRVPADARWFSGSCRSVSRNARPAPLNRGLSTSGGRSVSGANGNNNVATLNMTPSGWTESGTPPSGRSGQPEPGNASGRTSPVPKKMKTELPRTESGGGEATNKLLPTQVKSGDQTQTKPLEAKATGQEASTGTSSASKKRKDPPQKGDSSDKTTPISVSDTTEAIKPVESKGKSSEPTNVPDKTVVDSSKEATSTAEIPAKKKKKDATSTVDQPIPKKKDLKKGASTEHMVVNESTSKGNPSLKSSSISPKDTADKKPVLMEGSKKQDLIQEKEGETSKGNEGGKDEETKQEDPMKRRITRKRKSVSESDK